MIAWQQRIPASKAVLIGIGFIITCILLFGGGWGCAPKSTTFLCEEHTTYTREEFLRGEQGKEEFLAQLPASITALYDKYSLAGKPFKEPVDNIWDSVRSVQEPGLGLLNHPASFTCKPGNNEN
jgi:hypothetical protein